MKKEEGQKLKTIVDPDNVFDSRDNIYARAHTHAEIDSCVCVFVCAHHPTWPN
jgi:hypothetical protein